ncbi:MAG: amidohydrolase [Coprothermobacterota bacterium]|nr:amidohydrolase [Coprothermobacterota bacterium]
MKLLGKGKLRFLFATATSVVALIGLGVVVLPLASCSNNSMVSNPADTIFVGGPIITVTDAMPEAQALAVKNGMIVAVGERASVVNSWQGPNTTVVDLAGKTLMPGFVEAHMHYAATVMDMKLMAVDVSSFVPPLDGTNSLDVLVRKLTAAVPNVGPNQWLTAWGYDPSYSLPLYSAPTATILDGVSNDIPIFVISESGHQAWVNHKALTLAGITDSTPNPEGGVYVKDSDKRLTGELQQPASYRAFSKLMPAPSPEAIAEGMMWVAKTAASAGITTTGDMLTGTNFGVDAEVGLLKALAADPSTPVRIFSYLDGVMATGTLPVQPNEGNDRLRFLGIKFSADGSPQAMEAAVSQPYLYPDGTTNKGFTDYADAPTLLAAVQPFFNKGWQLAFHANGDVAIDQVLDVATTLLAGLPDPSVKRMRIEHFTLARPDQIKKAKQLGMTPNLTIGHTYFWGQVLSQTCLGSERAAKVDPLRSVLDAGMKMALNSDWYFMPAIPLRCMQNAVTRMWQWLPQQVLGADERITVDEAIRAVTIGPAYQLFMDDKIGTLEVGKYADLVVLAQNPRTIEPSQLMNITVVGTYLAGVKQTN